MAAGHGVLLSMKKPRREVHAPSEAVSNWQGKNRPSGNVLRFECPDVSGRGVGFE